MTPPPQASKNYLPLKDSNNFSRNFVSPSSICSKSSVPVQPAHAPPLSQLLVCRASQLLSGDKLAHSESRRGDGRGVERAEEVGVDHPIMAGHRLANRTEQEQEQEQEDE
eukprot:755782-Hanusia_phi.AAC.2